MGTPTGLRTLFLIIPPLVLLLPISIILFALDRLAHAFFIAQAGYSWRASSHTFTFYGPLTTGAPVSEYAYITISMFVNNAATKAYIILSIAGALVATVGMCTVWELRRVEGTARHDRLWAWVGGLLNLIFMGACVGVFGWVTGTQSGEGWKSYEDVSSRFVQRYTRETWVCQIDEFFPRQGWAGKACGVAKATRFLLLVVAFSALLTLVSIAVLVHDRGGVKWLFGGKGRYGGFDNVYEMKHEVSTTYYGSPPQRPMQQQPQAPMQQQHQAPMQQQQQAPIQQPPQAQQIAQPSAVVFK
ncbi:hypothetical protein M011DRAFT_466669 [Sporormia fimetaria CBS 119925]|uniref:MARVEL domain-containing protein n=1 Tax=Sporormia fimetaria CBS 119925 TaxID=1340428 RepID=A0A6A6VEW4_9PLEO|nr:hypothetical protein M011DRAFT_466669 [Sporormia fimetaria CBS 119925]